METQTGGRAATDAVIPGDICLSVGNPQTPLPTGWKWLKLTDVARLESGHTPSRKKADYWGGDVPWIGIKDATGNHGRTIYETTENTNEVGLANSSARLLPADTVCLSRTASVGYVIVMGRPMATSQDFVNWVCSDALNPHFLKYALLAEQRALRMFAVGSVHSTIYFPEVKAFHIAAPDREAQDRIVDVLGPLDDKIELNRTTNETLEAMAQAIFRDWFVDFGPVKRKMRGASDPSTILGGLLPEGAPNAADIANLFPDRLGDDGRPEGWEPGKLADIAKQAGETTTPDKVSSNTPYIGLEHMPRGSIALADWETAAKVSSNKARFKKGDVLFGKLRPYFHKVGLAPLDGICSTDIVVLRGKKPAFDAIVASLCSSADFVAYTDQTSTGTKMPRTSWKIMKEFEIALPPEKLASAYSSIVSPMHDLIAHYINTSKILAETRDYLLPKLMSGQVNVADAESVLA